MEINCPRCGAHLIQSYKTEWPGCVVCGFENYEHMLPKRQRVQNTLATTLRYIGLADKLQDVTVPVRVRRDKSKFGVAVVPTCPYDHKDMKFIAGSGYKKKKNEQTYKCPKRHRIILLSSMNGDWRGWM